MKIPSNGDGAGGASDSILRMGFPGLHSCHAFHLPFQMFEGRIYGTIRGRGEQGVLEDRGFQRKKVAET